MSLFSLFNKKEKTTPAQPAARTEEFRGLAAYSGMRVEVTAFDGRLLFVAKLLNLHGQQAELHQYSENDIPQTEEPLHVRIRGYSDHTRKAVYMEGFISPLPRHIWAVEELTVARTGNDRAFFRLDTDLEAAAITLHGFSVGEKPCRLLNISIGGAYLRSAFKYEEGDKFLLKVKLLEERQESTMFTQVVRVIEKEEGQYEYGCRFLELTEADQEQIVKNIFAAQREMRKRS